MCGTVALKFGYVLSFIISTPLWLLYAIYAKCRYNQCSVFFYVTDEDGNHGFCCYVGHVREDCCGQRQRVQRRQEPPLLPVVAEQPTRSLVNVTTTTPTPTNTNTNFTASSERETIERNSNPSYGTFSTFECSVCLSEKAERKVFHPCGHTCCTDCAEQIDLCHICRSEIQDKIRLFL